MNIIELAQNARRLEMIWCDVHGDSATHEHIAAVIFQFEGGSALALKADAETDELIWSEASTGFGKPVDLNTLCPAVGKAYGLSLTWGWEMKNHQGYFDAVQLEFTDTTLAKAVILQFKVAASSIGVFEVSPQRCQ